MSSEVKRVLPPGPSVVAAGRTLEDRRLRLGAFPYQWLFPGPHSTMVLAHRTFDLTGGSSGVVLEYKVPSGLQFSLRGVVFGATAEAAWIEGTGDLNFDLTVTSAGTRKVEFLNAILTHLGTRESPYPILGRLEFEPDSVLRVNVGNSGAVVAGFAFAHLVGHTYPQIEEAI